MTDLDSARESIELALNPPPPAGMGTLRRLARRLLLRLGQPHARYQLHIDLQLVALIGSLEDRLSSLGELAQRLGNTDMRVGGLERGHEQLSTHHRAIAEQTGGLALRVGAVERRLDPLELFARQVQTAPDPDSIGLERFETAESGTVIGYRHAASPVSSQDDYVAFEDVFRLSEDVIRERQRLYLSLVGGRQPVLDAGCGRGEFLELLREAEVPARGVDVDPGMVARSRAKGLEVECDDLVAHLNHLEDDSLGVVFAAQVVEHLPYAELVAFLRLAFRKLRTSGLLMVETVNPHAPETLKTFWTDPTHQHPLSPEVLLTLCRGIGFASAYVFHPGGTGDVDADRVRFGDYAIVAERGESASPNAPD